MITSILIVLSALILLYLILASAVFFFGFVRYPKRMEAAIEQKALFHEKIREGMAWAREQGFEKAELISFDGHRLAARVLPAENARGTLVLFHGYRSPMYHDFSCVFRFYHELGFHLIVPSQRAHGESEGKVICFGVKERYDCLRWAEYASERFGPESDIFLSGISMGCSTVLMASDLPLPENVRGIIADCGFTSPQAEFEYLLRQRRIPIHPIIDSVELFARLFAGFGFRDCSTTDCVRNTKIPILFIHGEADTFVPSRFTEENYAACVSDKELVLVKEASHGLSYLMETERCQALLKDFFERYGTWKNSQSENSGNAAGPCMPETASR